MEYTQTMIDNAIKESPIQVGDNVRTIRSKRIMEVTNITIAAFAPPITGGFLWIYDVRGLNGVPSSECWLGWQLSKIKKGRR